MKIAIQRQGKSIAVFKDLSDAVLPEIGLFLVELENIKQELLVLYNERKKG